MFHLVMIAVAAMALDSVDANDFVLRDSGAAKAARGTKPSKIQATKTEAAMKFIVIDKDKGPVSGIVVCLAAPDATKVCTDETDAEGYAEVLVPVGQKYDITYLSLGHGDIAATVTVTNEPKQSIKLTLRYKSPAVAAPLVLAGVNFDTAKATIRPESFVRLDLVVDFMTRKKRSRVEISGHTDNVGKPKANKDLSERRAQSCRSYLISKGIDGSRITALGFGDERPIAPNNGDEGRQKNRRIEAVELKAVPPSAKPE